MPALHRSQSEGLDPRFGFQEEDPPRVRSRVLAAVEALAFGFAVSFAVFGWPAIRRLPLGAPWLNKLLFITLCWFMGNWWMHDNLHMHIALDMNRLLYIEYGFHMSMLACVVILAVGFTRLAAQPAAKPVLSSDRVSHASYH